MDRRVGRRVFFSSAVVSSLSLAGCLSDDSGGNGDNSSTENGDDDTTPTRGSNEEGVDVVGSEYVDEDALIEVTVFPFAEDRSIRVLENGDELREIEPEREWFVQIDMMVDDYREPDRDNPFDIPQAANLDGAVIETGEVVESVSYEDLGTSYDKTRSSFRRIEATREPRQGDSVLLSPLFDAPGEAIAVDVSPILDQEEEIWLSPW